VRWNPYFTAKYETEFCHVVCRSNWDSRIYRNSFNNVISQHERHSCYYFVFDAQNVDSNEATEIQELLPKVGRLIRSEGAE